MVPTDIGKLNERALENFRQYLRIPSVQPNVNYDDCVKFLRKQATGLGLDARIYEVVKGKPIVILTLKGTNPSLPSILLNSHMDVVPVFPEMWTYSPFEAELDKHGNIYARGAQDMKCVAIQYLEAVRRLIIRGAKMKRTIHISFVPDEEIGGIDGMKKFVNTTDFKKLNVGFVLDEGLSSANSTMFVFNAERYIWQIEFKISGTDGHGSLLLEHTSGEKMRKLTDRLMDFRQSQVEKLKEDKFLTVGDVATVNLTMMRGGVEANVLPPELYMTFDFRLPLDVEEDDFENRIQKWMADAGDGIEMKFLQKNPKVAPTPIDDSNPFWTALSTKFDELKLNYKICTFPGGTDGRYCRELGLPVIGFSPIINTPVLLHSHDEFLNKDVFLRGIDIYEGVIPALASV